MTIAEKGLSFIRFTFKVLLDLNTSFSIIWVNYWSWVLCVKESFLLDAILIEIKTKGHLYKFWIRDTFYSTPNLSHFSCQCLSLGSPNLYHIPSWTKILLTLRLVLKQYFTIRWGETRINNNSYEKRYVKIFSLNTGVLF